MESLYSNSDVFYLLKVIASVKNLEVNIFEAKVDTLAIQGPKSLKIMEKVFGKKIKEFKIF